MKRIKRVKHTRQELRAIHMIERVMAHVAHDPLATDLLEAVQIAMIFHYESDRAIVLRETWKVLRSIR